MKLRFPYFWLLVAPYVIFGLGAVLNILAITVNQGYMPVASSPVILHFLDGVKPYPGIILDGIHRQMQSSDHLKVICDWIQVPHIGVVSPGDSLLWLSDWLSQWTFITWLALIWKDAQIDGSTA